MVGAPEIWQGKEALWDIFRDMAFAKNTRVIRSVLEEQLDHMSGYMKKANIPYMDREQDVFKIALVGGFGNFYLVRQQLQQKFRFSTMDRRQEHIK